MNETSNSGKKDILKNSSFLKIPAIWDYHEKTGKATIPHQSQGIQILKMSTGIEIIFFNNWDLG